MLNHDRDTNLIIELSFTPEESVSIELNLPSDDGKKTEKIGPITYNLYKETLV
ncbi:putative type VI secretion protein [Escherichia coli DEC6E]|nr:putative type VI secretion protein [Escherichia coli DEC6E]